MQLPVALTRLSQLPVAITLLRSPKSEYAKGLFYAARQQSTRFS